MPESDRSETRFSASVEIPELEGYRPISPLVIAASIAALVSPLAMIHPVLWVLPVVAVVLSICAIVRVSASQSRCGGRRVAVVALCLAALIGSYAPARTISRDRALHARARTKAEQWLSLVRQGRVHEAHQFTIAVSDRFQGPKSLASHYEDAPSSESSSLRDTESPPGMGSEEMLIGPPPGDELKQFIEEPVIAQILGFGEQARIEHLQNVMIESVYQAQKITQRFRASGVHNGQPESIEFLIRATRGEGQDPASWTVGNLEEVD